MRTWAWLAVAVALTVGLAAGVMLLQSSPGPPSTGVASVGGPFRLVDQTGAAVDESLLQGRWSALFFGYTFCPDVCPTTLAKLGTAVGGLGDRADRFQAVFITVDPERDTPTALKSYLSSPAFPKATRGLTGPPERIADAARAYHVFYQKVPQGSSYSMDHSAVVYLMDPRGRFVRPLDMSVSPLEVARQIRTAMDGG